jgi:hypothetical protein
MGNSCVKAETSLTEREVERQKHESTLKELGNEQCKKFHYCTRLDIDTIVKQPANLAFGSLFCNYCAIHCTSASVPVKCVSAFECCCDCKLPNFMDKGGNFTQEELAHLADTSIVPPLEFTLPFWFCRLLPRFLNDIYPSPNFPELPKEVASQDIENIVKWLLKTYKPDHPLHRFDKSPKDYNDFYFHYPVYCDICREKMTAKVRGISVESDTFGITKEIYVCENCVEPTQKSYFRTNDIRFFRKVRQGRCGEFAQHFYRMLHAYNIRARLVITLRDHIWVEFYSENEKRWIHCEPCGGQYDQPELYEKRDQVNYVWAIDDTTITDVTDRYLFEKTKEEVQTLFDPKEYINALKVLNHIYKG